MNVWDPLRELDRLRREMDRIFESVAPAPGWSLEFLPGRAARRYPRINVAENDEAYVVEALAPGVDPAGLDVSVKDRTLVLSGEKAGPTGVPREAFHRSERAAGRFVRTLELPADVDPAKVRATYTDGIVRVILPKAEETRPRRIEIEVA